MLATGVVAWSVQHWRLGGARREARQAELRSERLRALFLDVLRIDYTDLDSTLMRLLDCLRRGLEVERVSLWLLSPDGDAIERRALVRGSEPLPEGAARIERSTHPRYFEACRQALVVAADDAASDPRTSEFAKDYLAELGIRSMMDVPLRKFGAHIGLVCCEHTGSLRHWTTQEQNFATAVATQLTMAFEHAEHREARENLLQRTLNDAETGLPNGVWLRDRIASALDQGHSLGLIVISLVQYRLLRQIRGDEFAAALIQSVARRLRVLLPSGAVLARLEAEDLALLIAPDGDEAALAALARRVRASLNEALTVGEDLFRAEIRAGYTRAEAGVATSVDVLIGEASAAALAASKAGAETLGFDPAMRMRARRRLELEQAMRLGLERGEFEPWFQPVVDVALGRVVGLEALLRWRHPTQGILAPAEFLPEAVASGLIVPIGRATIEQAVRTHAGWLRQGLVPDIYLGVNWSAPEMLVPDSDSAILSALARHGLRPEQLLLEVTETALLHDVDLAERVLRSLVQRGVRVCLDDFATGFSSLVHVKRFPLEQLKIEGSFVQGLGRNVQDTAIVRAISGLAAELKQKIVAEGIEAPTQIGLLRSMGVNLMQGYYFAEPMPPSVVPARISTTLHRLRELQAA